MATLAPKSTTDPWLKTKEESFRAGFRKMVKRFFTLPDGREVDFDIKDEGQAACVLALTPDRQVILAKQFRPGPEKVLLEMPGGVMDHDGEDALATVARELLEETGYSGRLELVGTCIDDAYSNRIRSIFIAHDCHRVAEPQLDQNEFIEIELKTLTEFRELLRSGEMTDVECGYLALDHLNLL